MPENGVATKLGNDAASSTNATIAYKQESVYMQVLKGGSPIDLHCGLAYAVQLLGPPWHRQEVYFLKS